MPTADVREPDLGRPREVVAALRGLLGADAPSLHGMDHARERSFFHQQAEEDGSRHFLLGELTGEARATCSSSSATAATNGQAARDLGVSEATVRTHLQHAYAALGVHNRRRGQRHLRHQRAGSLHRLREAMDTGPVRGRTCDTRDEEGFPMRAIWKGSVSFGLVSVPVKLYSATESHDVSFRQVHATDGGRIRYQRLCSLDGEEIAYADIAKGYETEDGEMVILTDDDLADLPVSSSREIAVEKFVPTDQIDAMLLDKCYYLEPEGQGSKPYALLRQALVEADRMAIVTVALRQRTTIAVLRVREDVIVLQTMLWPDEIRTPDFSIEPGEVKDSETKMARMLVDTLAGDFVAEEFEDDYAAAVQAVVKAKVEGGEVQRTETSTKSSGEVVDLLAALQRSVSDAKQARGEGDGGQGAAGDDEPGPAAETGTKKASSKKTTAKKADSKKTASKKAATKKADSKKAAAKKTASKKTDSKKAAAKKTASKKTDSRKAAAKKAS